MASIMTKKTETFRVDSEEEATEIIEDYKSRSIVGGYTVAKTKVDYKTRKARSGENKGQIEEEWWMVEITVTYD